MLSRHTSHLRHKSAAPVFQPDARRRGAPAGLIQKGFALVAHVACLGLFVVGVVMPLAEAVDNGELAREFKPLLEAVAGSESPACPSTAARNRPVNVAHRTARGAPCGLFVN